MKTIHKIAVKMRGYSNTSCGRINGPSTTEVLAEVNAILDAEGDRNPEALLKCVKLLAETLYAMSIELVPDTSED